MGLSLFAGAVFVLCLVIGVSDLAAGSYGWAAFALGCAAINFVIFVRSINE
jgi:hypothetical protein